MRAVVLSNDRNIEFLNENFINAWVSNVELERTPNKQAYMALRRQQGFKPFDKMNPLVQAIMKGWKKHSPSDSLIISTELEVMGRQPVNELISGNMSRRYLMFLKASLDGKYPGLRENAPAPQPTDWEKLHESDNVMVDDLKAVLTDEKPQQEILSIFRTPEPGFQDYTVVEIDVTAFENGGWLTIDIWVGDGEASGSFDLFDGNSELPTEGIPNPLASAWDIPPGNVDIIDHYFDQGQIFKLGATGNWFSEKGSTNGFLLKISVETGQKPEPRKVLPTHSYQSPEDLMNAFVKAFKDLDSEAMRSMLTGRAIETFGIEDVPEDARTQFRQMLNQMEIVSSQYVDDEFHFLLRLPVASPPEMSFKMRKMEDKWLIYDVLPFEGD